MDTLTVTHQFLADLFGLSHVLCDAGALWVKFITEDSYFVLDEVHVRPRKVTLLEVRCRVYFKDFLDSTTLLTFPPLLFPFLPSLTLPSYPILSLPLSPFPSPPRKSDLTGGEVQTAGFILRIF